VPAVGGAVIAGVGLIPTIAVTGAIYVGIVGLMFFNPALLAMDARPAVDRERADTKPLRPEPSSQSRQCATMKAGLS
jgi:hypothetical protein